MIDKNIWSELSKIDEDFALMPDTKKKGEEKTYLDDHSDRHKDSLGCRDKWEYRECIHALTSFPAIPIQEDTDNHDIMGYKAQDGRKVKFVQFKEDVYIISAYKKDPVTGVALTGYDKRLRNILQDADPYRFYELNNKEGDYRYKCDLDDRFEGLKFFNNHPEYHRNTDPERIKEIRQKLYKREKLDAFNTDRE